MEKSYYTDLSDDELESRLRQRGLNSSEIEIVLENRDEGLLAEIFEEGEWRGEQ